MKKFGLFDDIDIEDESDITSITLDDLKYIKELKQRKLYLECEVDQYSISDIVHQIMQFNVDDKDIPPEKRQPIRLYISSVGGEVDPGFSLIDAITMSKTPVYTINTGYEYSMGFLIGLAGHKRFTFPNAKFLLHDGSSFVYGSSGKVQDQAEFNKRAEAKIKDYVVSHTKITPKQYNAKQRIEWYMFADDAKELGVVDYIIGTDCEISEVL